MCGIAGSAHRSSRPLIFTDVLSREGADESYEAMSDALRVADWL